MPDALHLVVYLLAVARVVKLITSDRITLAWRERFVDWAWMRPLIPMARLEHPGDDREGHERTARNWARDRRASRAEPPLLAYMATCPWCVSIYVGAVAAPLVWFWGSSPWLAVPALALACSYAVGVLATKGE